MSDDCTPAEAPQTVHGRVVLERTAAGSKSEREAVMLDMGGAGKLLLRRVGGHPLRDAVLHTWVGRTLTLKGWRREGFFLVDGLVAAPGDAAAKDHNPE